MELVNAQVVPQVHSAPPLVLRASLPANRAKQVHIALLLQHPLQQHVSHVLPAHIAQPQDQPNAHLVVPVATHQLLSPPNANHVRLGTSVIHLAPPHAPHVIKVTQANKGHSHAVSATQGSTLTYLHHQSASIAPQENSPHQVVPTHVQSVRSVPSAHKLAPQTVPHALQAHSLRIHLLLTASSVPLGRTVRVEHQNVLNVSKVLTAYNRVRNALPVLQEPTAALTQLLNAHHAKWIRTVEKEQ
jgi:hypothetical protein